MDLAGKTAVKIFRKKKVRERGEGERKGRDWGPLKYED